MPEPPDFDGDDTPPDDSSTIDPIPPLPPPTNNDEEEEEKLQKATVVNVAANDTLNIRLAPNMQGPISRTLKPGRRSMG